jgi:hypothetical protein
MELPPSPTSEPQTDRLERRPGRTYLAYAVIGAFGLLSVGIALINMLPGSDVSNFVSKTAAKSDLHATAQTVQDLAVRGEWETIYETHMLPSDRQRISVDQYGREARTSRHAIISSRVINASVDGDIGVITVERTLCPVHQECVDAVKKSTRFRANYYFVNGRWYTGYKTSVLCTRAQPYPMTEEFQRAISMIEQRYRESTVPGGLVDLADEVRKVRTCLDIQYATSNAALEGAEGVFLLNPHSQDDHLQIFVSPRYQAKDDLLTASLLGHEIDHAIMRARGRDTIYSCFELEAWAFQSQDLFLYSLKPEEKLSLAARAQSGLSEESLQLARFTAAVVQFPGEDHFDKTFAYVQSQPFYQKQCAQ